MSTKTAQKRDWKKIVDDSDGTRIFLPEALVEDVKTWQKQRDAFQFFISEIAEKEIQVNVKFQTTMLKIREFLAKNGHKDIWIKDVGIENEALKEGQYVLNITDEKKAALGMPSGVN